MSKEFVNASYIQSLTVEQLKIILLIGFSEGSFKGFDLNPDGNKIEEISDAFNLIVNESSKEVFRQALYQAVLESVSSSYEQKVLAGLIYLSRLIGVNSIIEYLAISSNEVLQVS